MAKANAFTGLLPVQYYSGGNSMQQWQAPIKGYSGKVAYSYNAMARVIAALQAAFTQPNNHLYVIVPCHCNPAGTCICGYSYGLVYRLYYNASKEVMCISYYWATTLAPVINGTAEFMGSVSYRGFSSYNCAARFLLGLTSAQLNCKAARWLNYKHLGV